MKKKAAFLLIFFVIVTPSLSQEIHKAVQTGDLENVKTLLDKNPDLVNAKDKNNYSPLHYAASLGHKEIGKLLIEKGSEINSKDYIGQTPLHLAGVSKRKEIVELLLENGAKTEIKDAYGRTPLLLTVRETGNMDIIAFLTDNGADINTKDIFDATPIDLAAWRGFRDVVNFLIEKGAEITATGEKGNYLLPLSTSNGLVKLFRILMKKGADPNFTNDNGSTLLHSAAQGGSVEITDLLIEKGLNVNKKDRQGWTPLHYAADRGHVNIVELFLQKGSDINARNAMGQTPFNLAQENDNKEVLSVLKLKGADVSPPKFPVLMGEYLGQKKPGTEPKLFAPGIVSAQLSLHSSIVFSPDGNEAYWAPMGNAPGSGIMFMQKKNNRWIAPQTAPFSGKFNDDVPFFSPDGRKLYFISSRPFPEGKKTANENIWFMERQNGSWSEPEPLNETVNSMEKHWQFSVDKYGNIYFGSSAGGGKGGFDIYFSKFVNGNHTDPENLGDKINTKTSEMCPFISPEGDYLIFSRQKADPPDLDLNISFHKKDGSWTQPKSLGNKINTPEFELCPVVSPDGEYLFYLGTRNGVSSVFWVNTKVIDELRDK